MVRAPCAAKQGRAGPEPPPPCTRGRRRTQRFEAHIWIDKKQIYLGAYHSAVQAARGHDVMALRCKGEDAALNFAP